MSLVSNAETEENTMQAYFGKQELKASLLATLKGHMAADELIRGIGWENGRGCAIGCTFEEYDHGKGAEKSGLPEWLLHLGDTLHENTSADVWPDVWYRIMSAIEPGANLEPIRNKINIFIQERNRERVEGLDISADLKKQIIDAIDLCIKCHVDEMTGVAVPDWSAARSAQSAAQSAARSAGCSAGWSAARSAVWSAAESAWSAAWSACLAAQSAAWSAESAAREAEMDAIAEEFIRLCGEC